jgi:hypothetical protein
MSPPTKSEVVLEVAIKWVQRFERNGSRRRQDGQLPALETGAAS